MILYNRTVAPATFPVTTAQAKAACEVTFSDDDDYIDALIEAATRVVEEKSGKQLVSQTWTRTSPDAIGRLAIDKRPLIAVTGMTYYDRDDSSQSLTLSNFYVYKSEDRAWIEPKDGYEWPDMRDRMDALTITFTAGYTTVPETLVQAIKMLIREWYDTRATATEARRMEVPYGVDVLCGLERVGWVA